jgi:hypothetical protein
MDTKTPKLNHYNPIRSGLSRPLIAKEKQYKMGETFFVKDGESFYNTDVIQKERVVLQY